jgi:hypothetical protein
VRQPALHGVDLLLKSIADKNDRPNCRLFGLSQSMRENAANPGVTSLAIDFCHHGGDFCRITEPRTGPAFARSGPAKVDKLHIDARARRPEHFGLKLGRPIPRRLPTHGGIECKNQTWARFFFGLAPLKESLNLAGG